MKRFSLQWHAVINDGKTKMNQKECSEVEKPFLIITRTHIGYGSPNKQDTAEAHGSPLVRMKSSYKEKPWLARRFKLLNSFGS
jgi:transketolase